LLQTIQNLRGELSTTQGRGAPEVDQTAVQRLTVGNKSLLQDKALAQRRIDQLEAEVAALKSNGSRNAGVSVTAQLDAGGFVAPSISLQSPRGRMPGATATVTPGPKSNSVYVSARPTAAPGREARRLSSSTMESTGSRPIQLSPHQLSPGSIRTVEPTAVTTGGSATLSGTGLSGATEPKEYRGGQPYTASPGYGVSYGSPAYSNQTQYGQDYPGKADAGFVPRTTSWPASSSTGAYQAAAPVQPYQPTGAAPAYQGAAPAQPYQPTGAASSYQGYPGVTPSTQPLSSYATSGAAPPVSGPTSQYPAPGPSTQWGQNLSGSGQGRIPSTSASTYPRPPAPQ